MRFIRQPDKYSCGPTAIINAAKWAGLPYTYKQHHMLVARLCESSYEFGTEEPNFEKGLRTMTRGCLRLRRRDNPSLASILGHLRQPDRAVVLLYWRPAPGYKKHLKGPIEGHYTLLLPGEDGSVVCVNDRRGETLTPIALDDFKKRIRFQRFSELDPPKAWFIQRNV